MSLYESIPSFFTSLKDVLSTKFFFGDNSSPIPRVFFKLSRVYRCDFVIKELFSLIEWILQLEIYYHRITLSIEWILELKI